jgi:hypothetical protein
VTGLTNAAERVVASRPGADLTGARARVCRPTLLLASNPLHLFLRLFLALIRFVLPPALLPRFISHLSPLCLNMYHAYEELLELLAGSAGYTIPKRVAFDPGSMG